MAKRSWEDIGYREALESCGSWNAQMLNGRKQRVPYFDSHTNIGQQNCRLYHSNCSRRRGRLQGQVYQYPSRRWKRTPNSGPKLLDDPFYELQIMEDADSRDAIENESFKAFKEIDDIEDPENDSDEEYISRSVKTGRGRGRRSRGGGGGRRGGGTRSGLTRRSTQRIKPPSIDDDYDQLEPQHNCEICGKKFLHKSALSYHLKQVHAQGWPDSPMNRIPMNPQMQHMNGHPMNGHHHMYMKGGLPPPPPLRKMPDSVIIPPQMPEEPERVVTYGKCETCKNGVEDKEGSDVLLICIDCKKSNHPACINVTQMVEEIKKYKWQCSECKSCLTCKLAEDDENLLFCDDCDRGCHLYCLDPPLDKAPRGRWTCHMCAK